MKYNRILILALFLIVVTTTCVTATVISVSPVTLSEGAEGTATLTLDSVPEGLSGYQLKVASDNQGIVAVTGATFPAWASLSEAVPESGSYALRAIDLNSGVEKGASNINLATVTVKAVSAGTAQIIISGVKIDDDAGNPVSTEVKSGTVSVSGSGSPSTPTTVSTTVPPTDVPTTVPTTVPPTDVPTTVPTTVPPTSVPTDSQQSGTENGLQITLKAGWNLINIPMQPVSGSDTAAIFKNVPNAGHSILTYDGSAGWQTLGQDSYLQPMT
ncbi:MAG: hypothetical protein LUQ07_02770, partial [Methanospirillum sp.]|nr:hypothetical protein [Methanospirillum sp.]